ncbi:MAG: WbqC family protein [Candidatus Limivicinus sp.]|jgi:hypothetical protein
MKASIHQPHYFPWVGYFDKMAKADVFVLLDEVQLEKSSQMIRNRVLDGNGNIKYLTISGDTKNFLSRKYCELKTKDVDRWTGRQLNALRDYYRTAAFRDEILPIIEDFFTRDYETVCQWTCGSLLLVRELLGIKTKIIYQSDIEYDRENKRSDLVYAICNAIGADIYFSGRGASVRYLDREKFASHGVQIVFQDFKHPMYSQCSSPENFTPGLSILDMLFNCGIEETKRIFWDNVRSSREFEETEK